MCILIEIFNRFVLFLKWKLLVLLDQVVQSLFFLILLLISEGYSLINVWYIKYCPSCLWLPVSLWWEVGVGGVNLRVGRLWDEVGREDCSLLWNFEGTTWLRGVCQAVSVITSSASQANETGFQWQVMWFYLTVLRKLSLVSCHLSSGDRFCFEHWR